VEQRAHAAPVPAGEIILSAADSAKPTGDPAVTIDITTLSPIVALVAGILILIAPRILNYVVAVYLIVAGITGLLPHLTH
jgi:hypothetical protein